MRYRGYADGYDLDELQLEAWAMASLYFSRARRKAVDRYYQFWHTLRASNITRTIVSAARRGTVDVLFLSEDLLKTNPVDPASGDAVVPSRSSTREEDLLNLAAIDTFLGGGAVTPCPQTRFPGGDPPPPYLTTERDLSLNCLPFKRPAGFESTPSEAVPESGDCLVSFENYSGLALE
jgi:hypothetical protein